MAGRRSGLCGLLRRKRKKEDPGAAPAQPPAEMQHFQPLQQDPGQDLTEKQDRPRGRFRRAVQRFLKFVGIRRRTPRTTPAEPMAEPDTRPTEIKPDVSAALTDSMETSGTPVTEHTASPDTAVADSTVKAAIEPVRCTAEPDTAVAEETTISDNTATDVMVKADITLTPIDGPSSSATALMDGTENPETALTVDTINDETKPTGHMANDDTTTESIGKADTSQAQSVTDALNLEVVEENVVSGIKEVPAMVRYIHQCLTSHVSPDVRMHANIRRLAESHPCDVVMTLLCCAPACDRAAAVMWSSIASSGTTVEKVLPILLGAMEDWPVHTVSTSDGNRTDVFALAATLALWLIIQKPECKDAVFDYAPYLLVALLIQIFMSTQQMPEEVNRFWRRCQDEHLQDGLPTNPNRFAVQTLKALLCYLDWENEMVEIERKCGWETLLYSDTHHYAVGLLAREMRHVFAPFHSEMAIHLLELLSREEPRWELPALAFFVELLHYLEWRKCGEGVLRILSRNLQSQSPERRRLALRGLLVLSMDPSMANSICSLAESLLELLHHEDTEMLKMTLSVFLNVLRDEDLQAFSPTAPKLAQALQTLFDHDNSHVQLLSIRLFREVMELLMEDGKETLVHQSVVPLYFCYYEDVSL